GLSAPALHTRQGGGSREQGAGAGRKLSHWGGEQQSQQGSSQSREVREQQGEQAARPEVGGAHAQLGAARDSLRPAVLPNGRPGLRRGRLGSLGGRPGFRFGEAESLGGRPGRPFGSVGSFGGRPGPRFGTLESSATRPPRTSCTPESLRGRPRLRFGSAASLGGCLRGRPRGRFMAGGACDSGGGESSSAFQPSDFSQLQQAQEDQFRVPLNAGIEPSFRADQCAAGRGDAAVFLPPIAADLSQLPAGAMDFATLPGEPAWPLGARDGLWFPEASQLVAPPVNAAATNEFGGAAGCGAVGMDVGDVASSGVSRDLLLQLLSAGLDMPSLQAMLTALDATTTATTTALTTSSPLESQPAQLPQVAADSTAQLLAAGAAGAAAEHTVGGFNGSAPPGSGRATLSQSHSLDGRSALPPVSPQVNARSRPQLTAGERPVPLLGSAAHGAQSSLRSRRGLPDLSSSLANARPSAVSRLAAATGGNPPLSTGKREAEAGMTGGAARWPLSPALKSPRSDGYRSPGGSRVLSAIAASPTGLASDMAQLRVRSLPTTPLGGAASLPLGSARGGVGGGVRSAESAGRGSHSRGSSGEQGYEVASAGGQDGAARDGQEGGMEAGAAHMEEGGGAAAGMGEGMEGGGGGDELYGGDGFGLDEGGDEEADGEGGKGGAGGKGRGRHSTKPRSVAERMRRERISARLKRLKDVMPRTDARTDTSAMLDDAVVYIRSLQMRCAALETQNAVLAKQLADAARTREHAPQ
ncbi:unnamed protein product, partial [Closterium sp. NIES-65]